MGMNIIGVAGLGVCALTLILGCIGCGLPYWTDGQVVISGIKVDVNTGLWYRCLKPQASAIDDDCGSIDLDDCKKTFHIILSFFIKLLVTEFVIIFIT